MRQEQQNNTQKLISENLLLTKKLNEETKKIKHEIKKIKRWIAIGRLITILEILLVIVPIALAIIYLPPFLKPYFEKIQEFYHLSSQTATTVQEVTDFFEQK